MRGYGWSFCNQKAKAPSGRETRPILSNQNGKADKAAGKPPAISAAYFSSASICRASVVSLPDKFMLNAR